MSNKILFVFEGAKTERQIVKNLSQFYLPENTLVLCVFGNVIYELYAEISKDEDLDIFSLLKEKNPLDLNNCTRADFAEIYLFFDYDGHSHIADDEDLKSALLLFNNETDKGKLYISYPMVEALKHISNYDDFVNFEVECKKNINYKNRVHDEARDDIKNFNKYNRDIWREIIACHLKKMNYIANSTFELPNELVSQQKILLKQVEKFIQPRKVVSVLSAFPVFIHDYYGNHKTKQLLEVTLEE